MKVERAAEQAVIGALLLEPERYEDVREWLELDDFDGTEERVVYETIVALHAEDRSASAEEVNRRILESQRSQLRPASGAFLANCMESCPAPQRAAVYGRMVLESSIRRHIGSEAAGLRQKAELAATPDELNRVFFAVDRVRREVENLHEREAKANGWRGPTPLAPIHVDSIHRTRRHDDVVTERTAILALVDQPSALRTVGEWLSPDDFDDWNCKVAYAEMQWMDRESKPVDPLTVAWTVAQIGLDGPVVDGLAGRAKLTSKREDAVLASRAVLERSVKAGLVDTAHQIEKSALDRPALNATGEAHTRLNDLWSSQRRLVNAGFSRI